MNKEGGKVGTVDVSRVGKNVKDSCQILGKQIEATGWKVSCPFQFLIGRL